MGISLFIYYRKMALNESFLTVRDGINHLLCPWAIWAEGNFTYLKGNNENPAPSGILATFIDQASKVGDEKIVRKDFSAIKENHFEGGLKYHLPNFQFNPFYWPVIWNDPTKDWKHHYDIKDQDGNAWTHPTLNANKYQPEDHS